LVGRGPLVGNGPLVGRGPPVERGFSVGCVALVGVGFLVGSGPFVVVGPFVGLSAARSRATSSFYLNIAYSKTDKSNKYIINNTIKNKIVYRCHSTENGDREK